MARTHAKLYCTVWSDPEFLGLTAGAQRLYMLLLSQPKLSLVGMLVHTPSRWSRMAIDTSLDSIEATIHELEASRFVLVDRETEELLIRTFVRHDITNVLSNSNLVKGLWRAWEAIESRQLRLEVIPVIPDSIWEYPKATPPAEALAARGQPPPNLQVNNLETDRSNQPTKPADQTSLSPKPSLWVSSVAANQADLDRPAPSSAAAVDNSKIRLTDQERQQRLGQAVDLLVERELERNPTRGPSPDRHRAGVRRGKLTDHHQRGHELLSSNPDITPAELADALEPPGAQRVPSDSRDEQQKALLAKANEGKQQTQEMLEQQADRGLNLAGVEQAKDALRGRGSA